MANKAQQELKTWLLENSTHTHQEGDSEVKPVVCHGNGEVSVRSTFFYKHGRSAESHGQDVTGDMQKPGAPEGWEVVKVREAYNQWPKESYFEATLSKVVGYASEQQRLADLEEEDPCPCGGASFSSFGAEGVAL